jgi:hypothetical protein
MPAVNYLAILVSALAVFVIGMVWYSPLLFARQWMTANGYGPEKLEAMKRGMGRTYSITFICYLVMGFVMALLIAQTGAATGLEGAELGGVLWLGFAATIGLTANLYSDKPLAAYFIDAGYQLAFMLAMGAILAAWR